MAYANLASLAMNHEDARGAARWGERALTLARELDDEAIVMHALNSTGTMDFLTSGPAARGTAERSLELALAAGRPDDALRAYSNLAWAAVRNRAYPLAERYLDAAIAYASDPEFDLWWIYLLGHRARVELDRGRWEAAAETAALVIRGRRASSLPVVLALTVIGRLRARRGDPRPWAPLDEALALTEPELQRIEPVAVARAEAAWLAGNRSRVEAETEQALALAQRCGAPWVIGELACWRRRAGVQESIDADDRRAVRARARRRPRAGRGVLGGAGMPVRGGDRARRRRRRTGCCAARSTSCAPSAPPRPAPSSPAGCASAAPPTSRAAHGRRRARTRRC